MPWHLLPGQLGQEPPSWRYPRHVSTGTGQPAVSPTISAKPPPVSEPTGPAGGDLAGSEYPAPIVAPERITLGKLAAAVVNLIESKLAKAGAVAGDLEGEAQAPTIGAGKVTLAKLAAAVQAKLVTAIAWEAVEAINASVEVSVAGFTGPLKVGVDQFGTVHFAGAIHVTAEVLAKAVIFTLPAACRPEHERVVILPNTTGVANACLLIKTNGEVSTQAAIKATLNPCLDGVTFPKAI